MINTSQEGPKELHLNGLQKIVEAGNLQRDMADQMIALQVIDINIFDENAAKKNIKGRATLSDGVSKVQAMFSERTYNAMVS